MLALWVMWADEERKALDWSGRVWGYTGGGGLVQALAAGYFLWDICISFVHVQIFGWGMLAHAVAALAVFSLGFVSSVLPCTFFLSLKSIVIANYMVHL